MGLLFWGAIFSVFATGIYLGILLIWLAQGKQFITKEAQDEN